MYPIKTITMMMKCLTNDIPIFKSVYNVELPVARVVIFRLSLLEIWEAVTVGTYYTKISKEAIQYFIDQAAESKRLAKEATNATANVRGVSTTLVT